MSRLALLALLAALAALSPVPTAAQDDAGQPAGLSIQERINQAAPGDTVVIDGGTYRERIVIDRPLMLVGRNWPVIDGGGQGDVVTIAADDVALAGFVIRGSSRALSQEPAAIKADGVDRLSIRGNRIEDSHFGIHVTDSEESAIEDNVIDTGADTPVQRRGHGIYLWQVSRSVVHGNTVRHAADGIHLEFSDDNGVGANTVTGSRYALHLMYAHGNRIIGNTFEDNLAGAVLMFSNNLILKDNELSGNRKGATGAGVLLKDVNDIWAEGNRVLRNKYGISGDGVGQQIGSSAFFQKNLLALNDTGVALMSSTKATFFENAFIDNTVQVKALSGDLASRVLSTHGSGLTEGAIDEERPAAQPTGVVWAVDGRGNYWSDYRGYDADSDGVGDRPYLPRPPFAGRLDDDDSLRLFQFTLAQQAIDVAADMFPVYRYDAVIEDGGPLMKPPEGLTLPRGEGLNRELLVVSLTLAALSVAGVAALAGFDPARALRRSLRAATRGPAGGGAPA